MVQSSINPKNALYTESSPLQLIDPIENVKAKEHLRKLAISTCLISVILNLVLFILGVVFAVIRESPATYAFAVDCALDLISSCIVLWRYFGSASTGSSFREKRACISLGLFFMIAGVGVIIEGAMFIIWEEKPKWSNILLILAAIGFAICVILGIFKYVLYRKLKSKTLFLDAINSVLSGMFALIIILSNVVYAYEPSIWYLDPSLSIVFSIALVIYGLNVILVYSKGETEAYDLILR